MIDVTYYPPMSVTQIPWVREKIVYASRETQTHMIQWLDDDDDDDDDDDMSTSRRKDA
jgi:hypothetical protein